LPAFIEVDLSHLALGHSIHVADLKLPKGVQAVAHGTHTADAVVATVQVPRGMAEAEVTAEADAAAAASAAAAPAPAAGAAAPAAKKTK
jgi:large subunit ribosomal protein L25